jgi:hypothetical protein
VAWRKIDSLLVGILAETTKIPTRSGYFASGERVDQVENACVLGSLCPVFREIATTRRLWFLNDVFIEFISLGSCFSPKRSMLQSHRQLEKRCHLS